MKTSFALLSSSCAFLCVCADMTLSLNFTRRISPKLSRNRTERNTKRAKATSKSAKATTKSAKATSKSAKATSKSAKGAKSSNNSQLPWPSTTTFSPTSTFAHPSPRPSQFISAIPSMAVSSRPSLFDTSSTKVPKNSSSKAPLSRKNPKSKSERPSPSPSRSILANPSLLVSSEPSALETNEYYLSSSPTTKITYPSKAPFRKNPKSTFAQPSSRPSQFISPDPSMPVNSEPPSLDTSGYNLSSSPSSSQSVYPTPTIEPSKPSKFDSASLWPSVILTRLPSFHGPTAPTGTQISNLPSSTILGTLNPSTLYSVHPTQTKGSEKPSNFPNASLRPSTIPTRSPSPSSSRPTPITASISFSELIMSLNLSITRRLSTNDEDTILQMLLHTFCVDVFATHYATFHHCDILVQPSTNVEEGNAEVYILSKKVSGSVSFALQQDLQLPDTKELDARIAEDLQGPLFLDALQNSDDGLLPSTQQVKVYYPSKDGGTPKLRSKAKSPAETEGARKSRYLSIILSMICTFVSIYIYHTKLRPILSRCRSMDNGQPASACSPPAYLEIGDEPFDETSILGSSNKASLGEDTVAICSNSLTPNTRNIKKGDPFRDVKCHHILELDDDGSDLMTTGTFDQLWNDEPSVRAIV